MKFTGENVIAHPVDNVWDALLDPRTLGQAVPGCEKIETVGPDAYAMTVMAGVAAIKGTYDGQCELSNMVRNESLVMSLSGSGAPGTVDAKVDVAFATTEDGSTRISYEADATIGGMVGGVGSRMLSSVSKRMAGEFFGNVGEIIANGGPAPEIASTVAEQPEQTPESAPATTLPRQQAAPATTERVDTSRAVLQGVGIGAALVALGVALGAGIRR